MTAVHISGEQLHVAVGKWRKGILRIERVLKKTLPYGSAVGSRIVDVAAVSDVIRELSKDKDIAKHRIRVTLDTGAVMTKLLTLPDVKSRKYMRRLVEEHFSVGGVVSYTVLQKNDNGTVEILACMAEKELLKNYIDAFRGAGFGIGSIDISACGIIRLSEKCSMLNGSSYAVCIADDTGISRFIFENGKYCYGGRDSIFVQQGTEEFSAGTARSVEALIQVSGKDISNVLMSGVTDSEAEQIRLTLSESGIRAARFPMQKEIEFVDDADISDHLAVIAALV